MNYYKSIAILFCYLTTIFFTSAQANQIPFVRVDKGAGITEQEREKATDELISILKDTQYFDFVASHVHGSPESDSSQPFWWASWWTGVKAKKSNNQITYVHSKEGTDNAGIFTSPYLEGACYAYLLTGEKKYAHLARRLMRGMSAWILSSSKSINESPKILQRSFYPASVYSTDDGHDIFFDYEANHPGKNGVSSGYVHNPYNPTFGDIWLKHKRSIDDIGHMIGAIAQVQACRNVFDDEAKKDLDQMNTLYSAWGQDVDKNKFIIPFYDFHGNVYLDKHGIGDYNTYNFLGGSKLRRKISSEISS